MRYLTRIFLSILVCAPLSAFAGKGVTYLPSIDIRERQAVKKGSDVKLSMFLDLSRMRIRTQHTVALTPYLVSGDGLREAEFPTMVIDGSARHKVYRRAQRLKSVELPASHNDAVSAIIRRQNGREQTYRYTGSQTYENWMDGAHIEIRETVRGCVNCDQGRSAVVFSERALPFVEPDYLLTVVAPEPEPDKIRTESRSARLQFRQNSCNISTDYKDNRAQLDSISQSIQWIEQNEGSVIAGIFITGFASPEASVAYNDVLSQKRAEALGAHILARHPTIDPEKLHIEGKGEDWEGLRQTLLEHFPRLLHRDQVLAIIDRCGEDDRDLCESRFRSLKPEDVYRRLLNEVYPLLRRNECRIVYKVPPFDLEQSRRILREHPEWLSLAEIYRVAASYEKSSSGYREAMEVAARLYPSSAAVANDRAREAIDRGEYVAAAKLIEEASAERNAGLLNTLGVAYAKAGRWDEARNAFRQAAQAGCGEAVHNLEQLQKAIE